MQLRDDILSKVDFNAFFTEKIKGWKLSPRGDQGVGFCPIPSHQDDRRSFSGNATNGLWNCKGCGAKGDYFTLWGLFNNLDPGRDFKEMLTMIAAELAIDTRAPSSGERKRTPPPEKPSVAAPPIPEKILEILKRDMTPAFLDSLVNCRFGTLTPETFQRFEIGWDAARKRYAIPVRDEQGLLRNIRLYNPSMDPKIISWFHYECPRCKLIFRDVVKKGRQLFCQKCGMELPKECQKTYGEGRLYPLPAFLEKDPGEFVFCEGEWDCLCLWERGIPSLTSTAGAGAWKREWMDRFEGRRVLVLFDCDPPGLKESDKHAQMLLKSGKIPALKLIKLPLAGTKQEKDITDWFKIGRTTPELIKILKDAEVLKPAAKPEKGDDEEFLTYHIIARKFMETPYCQKDCVCTLRSWRNSFYMWNGSRYVQQPNDEVKAYIARFLEWYPALLKKKSLVGLVNDIYSALAQELLIPFDLEPPMLFNPQEGKFEKIDDVVSFNNGLLNLKQALAGNPILMKHSPNYFILNTLPYDYNAAATCPSWAEYLEYCWPEPNVRQMLQEFSGLCLVPDLDFQSFMVLLGEGGTGKSTFVGLLSKLVGAANVSHCSLQQLGEPFGLASLLGKLLNVAGEIHDVEVMGEGILKQIVGGDSVEVARKYKSSVSTVLSTRMIFAANQMPKFMDKSAGLWRKMIIIPCDVVIPPEKRDIRLSAKLSDELPGIFNWAALGLKSLRERKFFLESSATKGFKEEARMELNPARLFIADYTQVEDGKNVTVALLYQKYNEWCKENGYKPLNETHFGKEIFRYYPNKVQKERIRLDGARARVYQNLVYVDDYQIKSDVNKSKEEGFQQDNF